MKTIIVTYINRSMPLALCSSSNNPFIYGIPIGKNPESIIRFIFKVQNNSVIYCYY